MSQYAVWIDHEHAQVFNMSTEHAQPVLLRRDHHPHHSHHPKDGMHESEKKFFDTVTHALVSAVEILLLGPGTAKTEFSQFVSSHHGALAKRIVGTETCDHPTAGQILAIARKFFHASHQLDGTEARPAQK